MEYFTSADSTSLAKARIALEEVLRCYPSLNTDGGDICENVRGAAGYRRDLSPAEYQRILAAKRSAMLEEANVKAFLNSCAYLQHVSLLKSIPSKNTAHSYQQKHRVEETMGGYVCQGIFIAAALYMAQYLPLKVQLTRGGMGAEFNIKVPQPWDKPHSAPPYGTGARCGFAV